MGMTAVLLSSRVKKIDFKNKEINGKLKTVFYAESKCFPETGRMCIQWGHSFLELGDKFEAQGKITPDGTFIVWSVMRFKNGY